MTGGTAGFPVATGDEEPVPEGPHERAAAVRQAVDALLQIRRMMNGGAADPTAVPAPWELLQPVRAIALALEAAGIAPSAVDADGRRLSTGYVVRRAEPSRATHRSGRPEVMARVEWLGPPGSRASREQGDALQLCTQALGRLGWVALEYRDSRRHRWLEVEPAS
ncbi:hypothetical protein SNS2_0078 [Streptomyces netropsis]|nr:hypothetical protein SNS2_0078 [Streptomyces netropsis]